MVFARAAYSPFPSLNAAAKRGCHCRAGRPADHTAPFLLPSCAGLNGATARVLSEPHTSGFAARPKPPPETGRTVVHQAPKPGLGRTASASIPSRRAWRTGASKLKWIERARDNRTDKRRLPNR